jgi:hypothetical protein
MSEYHAIRVDMENNANDFWYDLRSAMPHVAGALERRGCVMVSPSVLKRLDSLGAFNGEPSPLIDYGTAGDGYTDVVAGCHGVLIDA